MTPDDTPDYEENVIWRLVGSRITSFGMSAEGEIYLTTDRNHEFRIGIENKEVVLFEVERKA